MAASPLRAFGAPRVVHHPLEGRLDARKRKRFKAQTRELPKAPGVYFFYGHDDRLLYVGKAKSLRERVRSYFADTKLERPAKIRRLLLEITRLEVRPVGSELEALLVERRLIAELQPLLNRQHKRFAVYPYLLLSDEAFPRLTVTRAEPNENDTGPIEDVNLCAEMLHPLPKVGEVSGRYLGPFTTPRHAFWALDAMVRLFPLRSCEGELVVNENGDGCFYREIGRCCGPCIGQTSREAYQQICDDLVRLLQTGEAEQIENLRARMQKLAEDWRFEEAGEIKQQLEALEIVAARLRRLERMRRENNAVIAQPALPDESGLPRTQLFLVRGGAVREQIIVGSSDSEWKRVKKVLGKLFGEASEVASFTAKTELDEMMILDRWLRSHGQENCVAWMNDGDRINRQWLSNVTRQLRSASLAFVSAGAATLKTDATPSPTSCGATPAG